VVHGGAIAGIGSRALIPFEEILEEVSEHFETSPRRLNNAAHATRSPSLTNKG